jgi:hypothetical protein
MVIKPHPRGFGVYTFNRSMGWRLLHTFTSLVAARSWISDRHGVEA